MANTNSIINEIMSNTTSTVVLLTQSDGEHIGFLSKLTEFYRHTFWLNADYDSFNSFPMEVAKRIYSKDEDAFNRIMQFKHCEGESSYDNVIISKIFEKFAAYKGDCLMILDNLELLSPDFDYSMFELFLKNAPKNLKIVLVSENFININYNIFISHCPKLYDKRVLTTETEPFNAILNENLKEDERACLAYISAFPQIDRSFVETLKPGFTEVLDRIARNHYSLILNKGNYLYSFKRGLSHFLLNHEPKLKKSAYFKTPLLERLVKHLLQVGNYTKALRLAIMEKRFDIIEEVVGIFLEHGEYVFMLEEYSVSVADEFLKSEFRENYLACKCLVGTCNFYKGNYDTAAELFSQVIGGSKPDTHMEYYAHYYLFLCMLAGQHYTDAVEYARNLLKERVLEGDRSRAPMFIEIMCRLPDAIRLSDIAVINAVNFKIYDNILELSDNTDKYWYAKGLQACAEVYFEWGNYGKAIKIINELKNLLPFYVIPYKLIDYYYFAGDMNFAMETAQKALDDAFEHNIDVDLADVYSMLARTSLYFNRPKEALKYIENAVNCRNSKNLSKYFAISMRSIIYAKLGNAEYGRDIAAIYAKYCEVNDIKSGYTLYAAIAYCSKMLGEYEQALFYARKCVMRANSRSGVWMLASSISLGILLESDELRDAKTLVEKILNSSANYGMITIVVNYIECFETILQYAKEHGIKPEYVREIERQREKRNRLIKSKSDLEVKFIGASTVFAGGEELHWKTRKAKDLFFLYVLSGEVGLERGFILDALWGDYMYVSAINNLKTTNNTIRNVLDAAGVEYKMEYANGKYRLILPGAKSDFLAICDAVAEYDEGETIAQRLSEVKFIMDGYKNGISPEMKLNIFREKDEELRDKILSLLVKLCEDLTSVGQYMDASRILNYAEGIDMEKKYLFVIKQLKEKINNFYITD